MAFEPGVGGAGPYGRVWVNGLPATDEGGVPLVWVGDEVCQDPQRLSGRYRCFQPGDYLYAGGVAYRWDTGAAGPAPAAVPVAVPPRQEGQFPTGLVLLGAVLVLAVLVGGGR